MSTKINATRKEAANPSIEVRLSAPVRICRKGWLPEFFAVCVFTSTTTGIFYEILSRLSGNSATEIVNWLLLQHKENGFIVNCPAERKRLTLLIAGNLETQAKIYKKTLRKYGYPLRFNTL